MGAFGHYHSIVARVWCLLCLQATETQKPVLTGCIWQPERRCTEAVGGQIHFSLRDNHQKLMRKAISIIFYLV